MIVDKRKLDVIRAQKQIRPNEMGVSKHTIKRINDGLDLKPYTVGKLASALGVDVVDIIADSEV